jgi:alkylation response protein AidB-like acyl-CoA dehydrogenase
MLHTVDLIFGPLLVWAREDQREKFLPGILRGETITMQIFTEPHGGSDLANVKSTAVRDGDDWIINGQKTFCTGFIRYTKLLFGPMLTDPTSPRHRNLGFFLIPRSAPGVTLIRLRLLNGIHQNTVILDNVRVPGDHLIGGDQQGWQVAQTLLEQEHGGAPTQADGPASRDDFGHLSEFVNSAKDSTNGGQHSLSADPLIHERFADVYIENQISTLWRLRNFSMYRSNEELSYHGSQSSAFSKESGLRQAERIRDVMGPYALLDHRDPFSPREGWAERRQRGSITALHPGGSTEVQKVIIARRLGLSRTQEQPAPTAGPIAVGTR